MPGTITPAQFANFEEQAAEHLSYLWAAMLDKERGLPLGHDGYLKLWALSSPKAQVDYILVVRAVDVENGECGLGIPAELKP